MGVQLLGVGMGHDIASGNGIVLHCMLMRTKIACL